MLLFYFIVIFFVGGFAGHVFTRIFTSTAQPQLPQSEAQVKEFVEEFRNFVKGIEGTVPDNVEQVLNKLTEISTKALPAHQEKNDISKEAWANLIIELNGLGYAEDGKKIKIIMEYYKKYCFNKHQIDALVNVLYYDWNKTKLRKVMV